MGATLWSIATGASLLRRRTTLPSGSTMQPSRSARETGSGTSSPVLSSTTENTLVTGHL
jgi:hypothetical protein